MLKPPFSIIQKRKHDEYVDYIEKSMLTKETEADTSLIIKDSDNFYRKAWNLRRTEAREEGRI